MKIQDFVDNGLTVTNDMGEVRKTTEKSIVFPNGWVGSIVIRDSDYSVAMCDYNGYFNWDILKPNGVIICKTEDEVCDALNIIKSLKQEQ